MTTCSRTIWKFPIPQQDEFSVEIPKNAHLLTLQTQRGQPCLWAMVKPEDEKEIRRFRLIGTGHPIPDDNPGEEMKHVGSFQLADERLIFHLFEIVEHPRYQARPAPPLGPVPLAKAQWKEMEVCPARVKKPCPKCQGDGRVEGGRGSGEFPLYDTCPACDGTGEL